MLKPIGNYLESKASVSLLIAFYLMAGFNHFINPAFYLPLIPPFFPNPEKINILSGLAEILLALGILYKPYRKYASIGIILILIAFIPSHIYFIIMGSCAENSLCLAEWIAWIRLILIHPLLLFWAWKVGNSSH